MNEMTKGLKTEQTIEIELLNGAGILAMFNANTKAIIWCTDKETGEIYEATVDAIKVWIYPHSGTPYIRQLELREIASITSVN